MSSRSRVDTRSESRPTTVACEACRRLKMRCIRPSNYGDENSTEPCQRCRSTNRICKIPEPKRLGRRPGAIGRYHGIEKAYRKIQSELKKKKGPRSDANSDQGAVFEVGDEPIPDSLLSSQPIEADEPTQIPLEQESEGSNTHGSRPESISPQQNEPLADVIPRSSHEPVSNPLALLADASDVLQSLEPNTISNKTLSTSEQAPYATHTSASLGNGMGFHRELLHRPGYVSLGLKLSRDKLQAGIDALIHSPENPCYYSNYFATPQLLPLRDVGPEFDPVDLGLVTMDEACYLFPVWVDLLLTLSICKILIFIRYFIRLHPVNGILDPMLHTPDFVRSRSALLFTWILALTAQFDHGSASLAKRLRIHGEKLSRHVHTSGYKSVEIVQGYYISLVSANPAETLAQERSWLYTMHAFGLAAELDLDQDLHSKHASGAQSLDRPARPQSPETPFSYLTPGSAQSDSHDNQRMARNRQRTWLRILLWERANSAACGRTHTFPETSLTKSVDSWWLHPMADPTDKHTCAFITLRRILASLQNALRHKAHSTHVDPHWVRETVDVALKPWCEIWLSHPASNFITSPSEKLSSIFLRYVYLHGRLWTLSFALHGSINGDRHVSEIRADCFEAAINACEVAVHNLDTIGEPLYCMLAPTWAMISYAGVLALKLFPALYGHRVGSDVELLALLSQVAIQLERAGTTPPHRFGIAGLLGQHLMMILRSRATGLKFSAHSSQPTSYKAHSTTSFDEGTRLFAQQPSSTRPDRSFVSDYDPFLTTASMSTQGSLTGESFADFFRETFGPGFGGVF
ncbi:unnamed protein product [Penicillium salamii]|uniref:Zn(2)-C6 fungal-type domain-containing protein n=1 Tax=Penicillium salamii TaxID=1612424 RepID=A0A9W4NR05_9EURO|nr:unnamed protein product [Penicillium salamii]CAG8211811.1 unnamed protein product [Penicillium salamii]CAG8232598.1 unnamed protein product [Penicillium salamii]CAG8245712.1 unnamed protein product [Penicillium salamii]CAG8328878.1 unnamed protein product [Penicillium salamii]